MKKLLTNSAIVSIIIVSAFSVWLAGNLGAFGINKITYDVIGYHSYTPAVFIKKDLTLKFYKDSTEYYKSRFMYWANETEDHKPILKPTYGMSLMYLPFTIWPIVFNSSPQLTGYELPFSIAISVSGLFYYVLSLFILYKALKLLNYSNNAIAFAIFCIGIGTNLIAYTSVAVGMPHVYNFFLLSCVLLLTIKWHNEQKIIYSILLGLCYGLLILIRPTNILFTLCFVLYRFDFKNIKQSVNFLILNYKHVFIIALVVLALIFPQLLYWKHITGKFFYNSYVGESFFFNNPRIFKYLFGFRKGWFIYTPIILLSMWGLFKNKASNPFFLSSIIITLLLVYLNSSWWCWWFGGGYSARAMIETYPLLLIGFIGLYEHFQFSKRKIIVGLSIFLILFNIKSVDLYRANIIHYDSMTFKAFVYTAFKIDFSKEDKEELKKLYQTPNDRLALKGIDT